MTSPASPPPFLRQRARHFHQTNAYASAGTGALVTHLVGYGITPAPQHVDRQTRRALLSAFIRFARRAGISGEPLNALVETAVRWLIVAGECFLRIIESDDGLRLQLLPPEFVDESKTLELSSGGYIEAGIEHDAEGRVVAYHVFTSRPGDLFAASAERVRVPADEIVHLFRVDYPGQVRGASWFAPVLQRLGELDKLEDAIAVGVQVAAMHAGVLVDQNGSGTIPYDGSQSGSIMESGLEPGTLKVLPSGYDIRFSTPQQAPHAVQVAEHEIRAVAVGLGVPAHLVSGDVSKANYSSLRADMNAFRARLEAWQWNTVIPRLMQPLWEAVIRHAALTGEAELTGFWTDPEPFFTVEWFPPRVPAVDPQKDAAALREMLSLGLMSRQQAVAELGFSVEDLDAEIAADRERAAALGLSFTSTKTKEADDGQ